MSRARQHGASQESRVELMSARGVSAAAYHGNSSEASDGWDSDGSEDSVFSIDDHHLPWEVTEKLLLAENSDIQLVAPQVSRSTWPSPDSTSRRNGMTATSGAASLFAYLPLAPLPQTVHAAEVMAEKIAKSKRMHRLLVQNRFRMGPRALERKDNDHNKMTIKGRNTQNDFNLIFQ